MNKYISMIAGIILFVAIAANGQEEYKREFRAEWVATVANIDWPKKLHRNMPEAQKADLVQMFDQYRSLNINAVMLQVRPECDALYQSAYEPWSRYLTWIQGDDPGYDPLQFALEEAHRRGIELHVWLNPYRINASANESEDYYHPSHIYREHPEWALSYASGKKILNPGRPEVMSYIGSVVRDILTKYAVDGVHFDDYFYLYGGTPASLDSAEYTAYGEGMSLGDWRRENVNRMIDTVHKVIQEVNPSLRFGVSPFGIYRDGVPSGIVGTDAYSEIYCDPIAWLRNGSIDYLSPQIYWPTGGTQDFESLVNWWADTLVYFGRHLFPGMGTYRLSDIPGEKKSTPDADPRLHESKTYMDMTLSRMEARAVKGTGDPVAPWTLGQIGLQIDLIRANHDKNGLGSVLFSAKDLDRVAGLADYLLKEKYTHPTLMPEMDWKADDTPGTPVNVSTAPIDGEYCLVWDYNLTGNERIAIYISENEMEAAAIILDPSHLQRFSFDNMIPLSSLAMSDSSWIVLTAISLTGREGAPSVPVQPDPNMPMVGLIAPEAGDTVNLTGQLTWESNLTAPKYQLQISTQSTFNTITYGSDWSAVEALGIDSIGLVGETRYFWRVRGKEEVSGPYSAAKSFFAGYPGIPEYRSPENLSQNVSTHPTFRWNASELTEEVSFQVSVNTSFEPLDAEETFQASSGTGNLATGLEKETWYYARMKGSNAYGSSEYTRFNTFMTTAGEIPNVVLLAPADLSTISSFQKLEWETSATEGTVTYQVEVALDDAFSNILFRSAWIGQQEQLIGEMNLEGKRSYYWKVRGKSEFGEGEYSPVRSFTAGYPSRPLITEPAHLAEGVPARPQISWTTDADADSVYVEISENSDFSLLSHWETFWASPGSSQLSASLKGFTWYYCRIRARNEYGLSVSSGKKYFMTGEGTGLDPNPYGENQLLVSPTLFTEGVLHIRYHLSQEGNMDLVIADLTGREVYRDVVRNGTGSEAGEKRIAYNRLPGPGLYYVKISNSRIRLSRAIIVK